MRESLIPSYSRVLGSVGAVLLAISAIACDGNDPVEPDPPPTAVAVTLSLNVDTIFVSWTSSVGATSYRVELAGGTAMTKATTGLQEQFTGADGVEDGTTYTATVYAINAEGETPSTSSPTVSTNYFMWDEFFVTSLHATGQGKQTFYNASPNGGFEQFTNISYSELSCSNCHNPEVTGGCASCHDSASPQLGAEVDASLNGVCGTCHSRQKAEVAHGYSDVHRDAGMGCMDCHSIEDVHGDGTEYASMLEDGAIDATCSACHTDLASNTYHSIHSETVDCTACHTQSVVTCYNCHFETEIELDTKKAYGQFKDWNFLVNRNGKVHTANFQSVKHGDNTMVGMAPFYAHTISRNAVSGCSDCHGNPNVDDWFDDQVIDVVVWDDAQQRLVPTTGIVPVPPNYASGGLRFDFADLDAPGGTVWSFLESGADRIQLLYANPLTQEQMDRIR